MKLNNADLFVQELETDLPLSTADMRMKWAERINIEGLQLSALVDYFINKDNKVLSRFLWLLSDVGSIAPEKLLDVLPKLFLELKSIKILNVESTFANYLMLVGVPEVNEAIIIDLLLRWINSAKMNVTTKTRSIFVLEKVIDKYPDFRNEFIVCLEAQIDKHSVNYQSKVRRILSALN